MRYRFLLFALLFFGVYPSAESYAQDSGSEVFITTKPNAQFYPVPKEQFFGSNHREALDYASKGHSKMMSSPQHAKVVGLTNLDPSLSYDTYIVMLKGKRFYVHHKYVQDNSYLEDQNNKLLAEYDELNAAVLNNERRHLEAFNMMIEKIDSIVKSEEKIIRTIDNRADSLELAYVKELVVEDISKTKSNSQKYKNWIKTLPQDVQYAAENFAILSHSLDATTGGSYNYSMSFVNLSSKTIKSFSWNGHVKNAQGDYITCQAKGISTFSEHYSGDVPAFSRESTNWSNVIYNKEAYQMDLTSLKIEYDDGTSLVMDRSALQYISAIPGDVFDRSIQTLRSVYEGLNDSALKAPWVFELNRVEFRNNLRNERQERQNRIKQWTETKKILLQEGLWSNQIEHMGIGLANSEVNKDILNELRLYGNTKRDKKTLDDNLLKFKRRNLIAE